MVQSSHDFQKLSNIATSTIFDVGDYTRQNVRQRLRAAGVRPTRQRMALAWLLFRKGDRHVTAELLHEEAARAKVPVSLATVYNTLHQFIAAGLLREIAAEGPKKYFDTNTSDHHHFLLEDRNDLLDLPASEFPVSRMPIPPAGYEISRVDVVFRLQRTQGGGRLR